MSESKRYINSNEIKQQSLGKYSDIDEVTKKWILLYKKLNPRETSRDYGSIIMEAISISEFVMENTLKEEFEQGRFIDNLNKLIEKGYNISSEDFNKLKKIKWFRNMAAHNTDTVMKEIIYYENAKDIFVTIGKLLCTLNMLSKEDITPSGDKLKANVDDVIGETCILQEIIGQGGSGTVFKAYHKRLDLTVAVKEIDHKFLSDLDVANEKNMLLSLRHEGIPRVYDIIEDNHTFYLIMDYIEGQTLKEFIDKMGKLPVNAVIRLSLELCNILSYLHNLKGGIVFRDLKPGNIMLDRDNHLHLIDFGISISFGAKEVPGIIYSGTNNYSSPEQLKGEVCDFRTDIYSLGAVIYFMVEGQNPSEGEEQSFKRSTPEALINIIEKAMAKDKEHRYNRTEELALDLNNLYSNPQKVQEVSTPMSPANSRKNEKKLTRNIIIAIVILLLVSSAVVYGFMRSGKWNNNVAAKNNDASSQASTKQTTETDTPKAVDQSTKAPATQTTEVQDSTIKVNLSAKAFNGKVVLTVSDYKVDGTELIVNGVIENNYTNQLTISPYDIYVMGDNGNKFPLNIQKVLQSGHNTSNIEVGEKREFQFVFSDYKASNSLNLGVSRVYGDLTNATFNIKIK